MRLTKHSQSTIFQNIFSAIYTIIITSILISLPLSCSQQKQLSKIYSENNLATKHQTTNTTQQYTTKIGFFNTQNLFDTINQPAVADGEYTPEGRKKWNTYKYIEKLTRITNVIDTMDCDIIGLCEVENYGVLNDITKISNNKIIYNIVHYESLDWRGIDQALLYNRSKFSLVESELIKTNTDTPKREILRVVLRLNNKITDKYITDNNIPNNNISDNYTINNNITTKDNNIVAPTNTDVVIYVLHLPSKLGGAKAAKARVDIIMQLSIMVSTEIIPNKIILGDMNENPIHVFKMINMARDWHQAGAGTYKYRGVYSMLDQILISPNIISSQMYIFNPKNIAINQRRTPASDHKPIYIYLNL